MRALAVTTRTRAPALPNVPTMIEQGIDYEVPYWTAIYAPAATPKPIVEKLAAEIAKAMKDPGVVDRLKNVGHRSGRLDGRRSSTPSTAISSRSIAGSCRTRGSSSICNRGPRAV